MKENFYQKGFINEKEYKKIINLMPILCIDFLIRKDKNYLLIKRLEEPLKEEFWLPGGRLRIFETIEEASERIQLKEIGRYFTDINLIAFSNYFFKKNSSSRACHTPTLLYEIIVNDYFEPVLDCFHSEYKWSKKLPQILIKNIKFFNFKTSISE